MTSWYLFLAPEQVRMDLAVPDMVPRRTDYVWVDLMAGSGPAAFIDDWSRISNGSEVEGDPSTASAEKGRIYAEEAVTHLIQFCRQFKELKVVPRLNYPRRGPEQTPTPMANNPWESMAPGSSWSGGWDPGVTGVPALPVMAVRGASSGPTLLMTGGVHGDEYEGPAAIARLIERLPGDRLRGMMLGLPVLDVSAWLARSRVSPVDGADLNRVFPGRTGEGDGPSANLAHAVFDTFVRRCDVLVDLHSGGAALIHLPLAGWYAGGAGDAERLARGFGTAFHPWLLPDVPGVLSYEAHRAGKVAVGAEWHGGARLDLAGMEAYAAALRHVQVSLGMLPPGRHEKALAPDPRLPISGGYQETPVGGMFIPTVALGEQVALGALLGTVRDPLGEQVTEVRAARAGIVAALPHRPLLHAGDRVAYLG